MADKLTVATALRIWKDAEALVSRLEGTLREDWLCFETGLGPTPTDELIEEVMRARREANEKLSAVLDQMRREREAACAPAGYTPAPHGGGPVPIPASRCSEPSTRARKA